MAGKRVDLGEVRLDGSSPPQTTLARQQKPTFYNLLDRVQQSL